MSGLEVVLIVGGAVLITKAVKEKRNERRQKQLAAQGLLPDQHGPAEGVVSGLRSEQRRHQTRQKPIEEEEALPLYSPPSKEGDAKGNGEGTSAHLPSYEEILEENEPRHDAAQRDAATGTPTPNEGTIPQSTTTHIEVSSLDQPDSVKQEKSRSKKWKVWHKSDKTVATDASTIQSERTSA